MRLGSIIQSQAQQSTVSRPGKGGTGMIYMSQLATGHAFTRTYTCLLWVDPASIHSRE